MSIVDGVVGRQGNGEAPEPKACGLLVGGVHPAAVDAVCARVMGFGWQRIPCLARAFEIRHFRLYDFTYDEIDVVSPDPSTRQRLAELVSAEPLRYVLHVGWTGHIELVSAGAGS